MLHASIAAHGRAQAEKHYLCETRHYSYLTVAGVSCNIDSSFPCIRTSYSVVSLIERHDFHI